MNTIPKSLHTVTALVNVARALRNQDRFNGRSDNLPAAYIAAAAQILGYVGAEDPHGLRDAAQRQFERASACEPSRSVQRRIAIQRGAAMPSFA